MAALSPELKARVERALKGLDALAVQAGSEEPETQAASVPAASTKPETPATNAEPTVTTKNELRIANEPVVPGQPLSDKQMSVMQLSINSGNTYPPEVMDQYNKQKATPTAKTGPTPNANSSLSQFSMKGLRFGMTVEEVVSITKATEDDYTQGRDKTTYSYPKKTTSSNYKSLDGFSIGGQSGWYPTYDDNKKLGSIGLKIYPNEFDEWFEKLTSNYGKPLNMSVPEVGNLMGYKTKNIEVWWRYQDVYIELRRFNDDLTKGSVWIAWNNYLSARSTQRAAQKAKNQKDFE
jgi:hypothetical protein